jgi:hypothetical protein
LSFDPADTIYRTLRASLVGTPHQITPAKLRIGARAATEKLHV